MDIKEYEERLHKNYKKSIDNFPYIFEKCAKHFGLKFNKEKYLKRKYEKSYRINKDRDLIEHFIFCYSLLCKEKVIDLPNRFNGTNKERGYDSDVITLLCILQKIFEANGKKIVDKDLIIVWGLLFEKTLNRRKKWWSEDIWKYHRRREKRLVPNDYEMFFKKKDDKFLGKSCFHSYKHKLESMKLKKFLTTILDECSVFRPGVKHMYISQEWEQGFEIYVNNLKLENLKKIKNLNYNYDRILEILKNTKDKELDGKCRNSRVLNYIYKMYRDIFSKSFF